MSYSKKPRKEYRQATLFPQTSSRVGLKQRLTKFSPEHLEWIFNKRFMRAPTTIGSLAKGSVTGYTSHGKWSTLGEIRHVETEERSNWFPQIDYPDDTPAIWVCLSRRKALRYMMAADSWDHLESSEPLSPEEEQALDDIVQVHLKPSDIIVHVDGEDGYLILRPRSD
jgi:hypothetical protein